MESLDSLARILGNCAIYEELYGQHAPGASPSLDAFESLSNALVELYILVLEYLCYLKRHLGHNTAGKFFLLVLIRHMTPTTLRIYGKVLCLFLSSPKFKEYRVGCEIAMGGDISYGDCG